MVYQYKATHWEITLFIDGESEIELKEVFFAR